MTKLQTSIARKIANKYNVNTGDVYDIYQYWWNYVINHIRQNNEYGINIPRIGKLKYNKDKINKVNEKLKNKNINPTE